MAVAGMRRLDGPGQESAQVGIDVVALDAKGKPVTDLGAADFAVYDNGSRVGITSVRLERNAGPTAVVVLVDMLNLSPASRGAIVDATKRALRNAPPQSAIYLYFLAPDGSLYPVHALPVAGGDTPAEQAAWLRDAGPRLDQAVAKVDQLTPRDFVEDLRLRFNTTYEALDGIRDRMAPLAGQKELIWVSFGVPSAIRFPANWIDCTPYLRKLAARFGESHVTVYTLDPGIAVESGFLNRESLEIVSGGTGGETFTGSDVRLAIGRAAAGARSSYRIEYQPGARSRDGKYHKLRVTLRRKGIRLQAPQGYFAGPGGS